MSSLIPFVETYRGGTLECQHHGALAVCDAEGELVAHAGDPHWLSFTRSTLKPFQALPLLEAGGAARFSLEAEQIAILCASHNGEPLHVAQVEKVLARAGLGHKALQCGCHVPLFATIGNGSAPEHFDERHHNCSGTHAGFLAWCVQQGQPTANYLAPGHPLQLAVRRTVADVVGVGPEQLKPGTDGCSAPNYAMPLSRLARAYARLAKGSADPRHGESFEALSTAMVRHPILISGNGRADFVFAHAGRGDWISKGGADGVQAIASRSRGQALAIKVADGSAIALHAATVAALDQLGWLDARQREELRPLRAEAIANARGTRVGERRAVFQLKRMSA